MRAGLAERITIAVAFHAQEFSGAECAALWVTQIRGFCHDRFVEDDADGDAAAGGFGADPRRQLGRRVPAEHRILVLTGHQTGLPSWPSGSPQRRWTSRGWSCWHRAFGPPDTPVIMQHDSR